jgi:hypothetical protein
LYDGASLGGGAEREPEHDNTTREGRKAEDEKQRRLL